MTVLILEDNPADVYLLQEALREAQQEVAVVIFPDGESACDYIDKFQPGPTPTPDVAVLDLNVPRKDGTEVLARIRSNEGLRDMPVVIFSSYPVEMMASEALRADCYIQKPSTYLLFLKASEQILDCIAKKRQSRQEQ